MSRSMGTATARWPRQAETADGPSWSRRRSSIAQSAGSWRLSSRPRRAAKGAPARRRTRFFLADPILKNRHTVGRPSGRGSSNRCSSPECDVTAVSPPWPAFRGIALDPSRPPVSRLSDAIRRGAARPAPHINPTDALDTTPNRTAATNSERHPASTRNGAP